MSFLIKSLLHCFYTWVTANHIYFERFLKEWVNIFNMCCIDQQLWCLSVYRTLFYEHISFRPFIKSLLHLFLYYGHWEQHSFWAFLQEFVNILSRFDEHAPYWSAAANTAAVTQVYEGWWMQCHEEKCRHVATDRLDTKPAPKPFTQPKVPMTLSL